MDREKVIDAFKERIRSCSMIGDGFEVTINWKLADDILALLKEQMPPKATFWDSLPEAELMEPMRHFKD